MLQVVLYPNKILIEECQEVLEFNDELHRNLNEMHQVLLNNKALGLAANQVGFNKKYFIILQHRDNSILEFINPKILESSGNNIYSEGCLSAPGITAYVPGRAAEIFVEYQDRYGEIKQAILYDIEALCFQHEKNHIDGIFFLDKVNRHERRKLLKKYEKFIRS